MSLRSVAFALLSVLVTGSAAAQSSGTRFTLMYLQNVVDMPQNRPVELHVTNQGDVTANVEVTYPLYVSDSCQRLYRVTVQPGSSSRIVLCPDIRHSHYDGGVSNKAVVVTSDVAVSVVGYNSDMYSADAFSVLPEQSLRSQYMTTAYAPTDVATQFGIVAANDVAVALYLPKVETGGKETFFDYNGVVYRNGDFFRFVLPRYHTFLAYSISDLSGIVVWANDSVAVFSGNARTYVDYSRGSRDHIVEQAVPSSQFGTSFAFYPIPRQHPGDVVRVVARSHTTDVTVYSSSSSSSSANAPTFRLNTPGEFYEGTFSEVSHFVATKTVSVSVIVRSQEGAAVASSDPNDPSIYFLPAVEHFSAEPRLTPIFVYSVNERSFSKSYILISVTERLQSGIRVDGSPVSGWSKPAASPLLVVSTAVAVDPSTSHSVTHTDAAAAFSAVLYSASDRESAATSLGLGYSASCFDRTQVTLGDRLDNDCDGIVDEENCTNDIDDDNDLLINEDCFYSVPRPVQPSNDYEVIFLSNDIFDPEPQRKVNELELYGFSREGRDMWITVKSPKYLDESGNPVVDYRQYIPAGGAFKFTIPNNLRLGNESTLGRTTLTSKGIRVAAEGCENFFLYGINKRSYSTDGFLAYPLAAADNGQEYKVYYTISSDIYSNNQDRALIGIVAHEDNTKVWVDLRNGVTVLLEDGTLVEGPVTLNMTLMAHDSWELQSVQDLSGSKVYTKKFISVYSGNIQTKIPSDLASSNHLVEQIPLTDFLGWTYSSISTPRSDNSSDLWKVIATESDTLVYYVYHDFINHTPDTDGLMVLGNAGDFFLIDPGYQVTIYIFTEDEKKILVGQMLKSTTSLETWYIEPALIFLPSPDQWSSSYWFLTPLSGRYIDGTQQPFRDWILIVTTKDVKHSVQIVDAYRNPIVGGSSGQYIDWKDVPGGNDQVAARVAVRSGQVMAFSNGPFMLIMFGVQDRESYGSAAGLVFWWKTQACRTSPMSVDDGIDNDCDGSNNEELFDHLDNDGDGRVDEDCYGTPNLSHRYYLVYQENAVEYSKLYALELIVGAPSGVNLFCRVSNPTRASPHYDATVIVPGGNVRRFEFSPSLRLAGSGVNRPNSFLVECSGRATVFALNKDTYSADGFVAFAVESLGSRYYVMSYSPEALVAQYAAIATEPGQTTLTITPPGKLAFNVPLFEGDVYQGQGRNLTGTLIVADKKFALFSGDVRTSVKISNSRDHLVSQIPSVDKWGTEFNLVPTAGRIVPDVYQILADGPAAVTICCESSTNEYYLVAGVVQQLTLQSFCHLSSSSPVLVARISQSQASYPKMEIGDPSLIIVVPESLYSTGDVLSTPVSTGGYNTLSADYSHYLTVIVPSTAKHGVKIDGVDLTTSSGFVWNSIACSNYSAGILSVPGNHHVFRLSHVTRTVRLTAVLDGSADRESYSVTLSQAL